MTQAERSDEHHFVHRLIGEIIRSRRAARAEEVDRIIEHIANAPFNNQIVQVPIAHQNRSYLGSHIGTRTDSLTAHLLKRIFINEQWRIGTTLEEFLADIKAATLHESARPVVYERRGGIIVGTLSENVTPSARRGSLSLPLIYIVYSSDRDSIISVYQASNVHAIAIPGDALWLR
jgi:hypothetical protein